MILAGRITVNGSRVAVLGTSVDPESDRIEIDGRPLPAAVAPRAFLLHKPVGFLCTCRPSRERGPSILELLPGDRRYFPVGRLDRDSSGLLIVTDDGELAHRLTHPRFGSRKVYLVETAAPLSAEQYSALRAGVALEDGPARPLALHRHSARVIEITLGEGRNRLIRRMIEAVHGRVSALHRIRIGDLEVGDLAAGRWRELNSAEIAGLYAVTSAHRNPSA